MWGRAFAVYKSAKESDGLLENAYTSNNIAIFNKFENILNEGKTLVSVCILVKVIYVKMETSTDRKQLAKDTRKRLQVMEGTPPVELMKRVTTVSTQ